MRTALVTGVAGGIGAAIAATLAARGWRVAGLDRPGAEIPAAAEVRIACDLADPHAIGAVLPGVLAELGRLDALVHAAGIARDGVAWKLEREAWDATLAVNLSSAFHLVHLGVPALRAAGGGSIVFLGSINAERGKLGQTAYAASKAGLIGLARSLAREVGRFAIRVNVVSPGFIRTPMTAGLDPAFARQAEAESCLGRLGEPEDIAGVVAFLLSPDARHITGQVLRVDGGQYL